MKNGILTLLRHLPLCAGLLVGLGAASPTLSADAASGKPLTLAQFAIALRQFSNSDQGGKADFQEVSYGQVIDDSTLAVRGKTTIVDFASDYCPPCLRFGVTLVKLAKAHPEKYALRRVNINRPGIKHIDWDSPVAHRYDLHSIPFLVIFDESGAQVAEGDAANAWLAAYSRDD